jgi:hypothetical protein
MTKTAKAGSTARQPMQPAPEAVLLGALERTKNYLAEAVRVAKEQAAGNFNAELHQQRLHRQQIPTDVWFPIEATITADAKATVLQMLRQWSKGTLTDFAHFFTVIETDFDLDPTYIFFGIPIRKLNPRRQKSLHAFGLKFATRNV